MSTDRTRPFREADRASRRDRVGLILVAAGCVAALLIVELGLRLVSPRSGPGSEAPPGPSPFSYNERVGYELRPFATVVASGARGSMVLERMNSEGFRGGEYLTPKPPGVFRILAVGDSVVQGLNVAFAETWEQVLERRLNERPPQHRIKRYEVINAGIGGYVSWQIPVRLTDHGLKYQPDFVLVLVGWNDLVYSSFAEWSPGMDLTKFEQAFVTRQRRDPQRRGSWRDLRNAVYRLSYLARVVRQARNLVYDALRIRALIAERQIDSGVPFNTKALSLYEENLEIIYEVTRTGHSRMGLIVWPTLLVPDLLADPQVHKRLAFIYSNFPLSTSELWAWYSRYAEAQRRFAAERRSIVLIDGQRGLQGISRDERLRILSDLAHLTPEGNWVLAAAVLQALQRAGIAP